MLFWIEWLGLQFQTYGVVFTLNMAKRLSLKPFVLEHNAILHGKDALAFQVLSGEGPRPFSAIFHNLGPSTPFHPSFIFAYLHIQEISA